MTNVFNELLEKVHLKLHKESYNIRLSCDECEFTITLKDYLKMHINSKDILHPCDECEFAITLKGYLTMHINSTDIFLHVMNVSLQLPGKDI